MACKPDKIHGSIGNISLINPKEDGKAKIGFALFNKIALAAMPSIK
jgi:hypothetical protein